jgi:hypothetical protein
MPDWDDERPHGETLYTRVALLENLCKNFVTQDEFRPIRMFVYGFVAMVMLTVLGYIMSKVGIVPGGKP